MCVVVGVVIRHPTVLGTGFQKAQRVPKIKNYGGFPDGGLPACQQANRSTLFGLLITALFCNCPAHIFTNCRAQYKKTSLP